MEDPHDEGVELLCHDPPQQRVQDMILVTQASLFEAQASLHAAHAPPHAAQTRDAFIQAPSAPPFQMPQYGTSGSAGYPNAQPLGGFECSQISYDPRTEAYSRLDSLAMMIISQRFGNDAPAIRAAVDEFVIRCNVAIEPFRAQQRRRPFLLCAQWIVQAIVTIALALGLPLYVMTIFKPFETPMMPFYFFLGPVLAMVFNVAMIACCVCWSIRYLRPASYEPMLRSMTAIAASIMAESPILERRGFVLHVTENQEFAGTVTANPIRMPTLLLTWQATGTAAGVLRQ